MNFKIGTLCRKVILYHHFCILSNFLKKKKKRTKKNLIAPYMMNTKYSLNLLPCYFLLFHYQNIIQNISCNNLTHSKQMEQRKLTGLGNKHQSPGSSINFRMGTCNMLHPEKLQSTLRDSWS